jgi:hypothetical protein
MKKTAIFAGLVLAAAGASAAQRPSFLWLKEDRLKEV